MNVLIGGRGSAKSESMARMLIAKAQSEAADVLCGREFQSSIDDSVHKLIKTLIPKCGFKGFDITDKKIDCLTGGGFRFKGFTRNPDAVKSAQDFKYLWVEEAQAISQESLDFLLPTIRASGSQLYFTANPQSSADPFSKRFIVPFQKELLKNGMYQDDMHLIVVMNWRDNPWHGELEEQRVWDYENKPRAYYDHVWEGAFNDSVENAIIPSEWFDAAIDAHLKLGFKPLGAKIISHDPSDTGDDNKGLCFRHGSVILDVQDNPNGDVNEGCDWATDYAIDNQADTFIWDCDGLGVSLRKQVVDSIAGKRIDHVMFKGSESVDRPGEIYQRTDKVSNAKAKTNKQTFKNKRAQYYWETRDRFYNTYRAVIKGEYQDPDQMISLSSSIGCMSELRAEVCRVPLKHTGNGMIQILNKVEMKRLKIESPNMADSVMMSFANPGVNTGILNMTFATAYD